MKLMFNVFSDRVMDISWHNVNEMDKEKLSEHKKKRQPSGTVPYTVSMAYKLWY